MKAGIYLTEFGNSAYVSGPKAKTAWDLDMQERIPIEFVNPQEFVRSLARGEASEITNKRRTT